MGSDTGSGKRRRGLLYCVTPTRHGNWAVSARRVLDGASPAIAPPSVGRICSRPMAVAPSSVARLEIPVAPRNPGMPLELDWVEEVRVNRSAVERRAATLRTRRTVKKRMAGGMAASRHHPDGPHHPLGRRHSRAGSGGSAPRPAGRSGPTCSRRWAPTSCPSEWRRSASTTPSSRRRSMRSKAPGFRWRRSPPAFPPGLSPFEQRIGEIHASVAAGAEEIDVVITRAHVLTENWPALYDEVRAMREACGDAHIKTILATGELGTLRNVARASLVCMMAGADFIKTSTGKEGVNATLPVGLVMARAIRDVPGAHRSSRRSQARRRNSHRERVPRLAGPDQGRAGRPLAASRPLPLRGQRAAHRYRAPARALRDRAVLRGASASDVVRGPSSGANVPHPERSEGPCPGMARGRRGRSSVAALPRDEVGSLLVRG